MLENVIQKAEKILKTDISYIVRGGSWLGFSQLISSFCAFLLSIAFANLLDPGVYGMYRYILSFIPLISIPTLSGMDSAVTRAVAQGKEGVILKALKTKLSFGSLSTIVGFIISLYYFTKGNSFLALSFIMIAVFVPIWEAFDLYGPFLKGRKDFKSYSKYYSLTQIGSLFFTLVSILFYPHLIFIITIYLIFNSFIRVFFFYKVMKKFHPNSQDDEGSIKYGKHLSLMDMIGTALGQIDKILIFHYLGAINLAIYSMAMAPAEQIKGALKNIQSLAMPKFANMNIKVARQGIFDKCLKLGIFVVLISVIYIIFAPLFFKIFFPKYLLAIKYSQIFSLSIVFATLSMFLYTFMESFGQTKKLYFFNIGSNILNLSIIFIMIYHFGLWGAILGRVIIRFLLFITSALLVYKE